MLPTTAEKINSIIKTIIFTPTSPGFVEQAMPETKTRESPGRKKPIINPVSAKITINNSHNPPYEIMDDGLVRVFRNSQNSIIKQPRSLLFF
jgi:hypothetical protein